MTQIVTLPDVKNAPKKEFLRDFNIAFACGNAAFLVDHVSEDIVWQMHGDKTIEGKEAFAKAVDEMKAYVAESLIIRTLLTHGKDAAVNGEICVNGVVYVFCDVYQFVSAGSQILKRIDSYVIEGR